jgi:hypothetical protein
MSYGERFKQINASIISQKCSLNAQHINVSSNTKQTDKYSPLTVVFLLTVQYA